MKNFIYLIFCTILISSHHLTHTKQPSKQKVYAKITKIHRSHHSKIKSTKPNKNISIPMVQHKNIMQAPTPIPNKGFLELEHKDRKPTDTINLDKWAATGQYHKDEKELHIGTLDTRFGSFSLKRSYNTHTEPLQQINGPQ